MRSTDIRAVVRDRIRDLGIRPCDLGRAVAPAWGCTASSAEATIHENFLGGSTRLRFDHLVPLLAALYLRLEPSEAWPGDVREIVRAQVPRDGRGRLQWAPIAERLVTARAWRTPKGRRMDRATIVEALSKTFGEHPAKGMYIDRLGPLFDAVGVRVVEMPPPGAPGKS